MLNPTRHCTCCGNEMTIRRSTKAFCSEACRKKAARGGTTLEQQIESRRIVECLRRMGMISKIWPVYLLGSVTSYSCPHVHGSSSFGRAEPAPRAHRHSCY